MKTPNDVVAEARALLQDKVEPYRYSTDDLLQYLNNGLYELKRIRPDAWLGSYAEPLPQYDDSTADTPIPVNPIFHTPLVMYVAGFAELRDDEFTTDGRAASLLSMFSNPLQVAAR